MFSFFFDTTSLYNKTIWSAKQPNKTTNYCALRLLSEKSLCRKYYIHFSVAINGPHLRSICGVEMFFLCWVLHNNIWNNNKYKQKGVFAHQLIATLCNCFFFFSKGWDTTNIKKKKKNIRELHYEACLVAARYH